MADHVNVTAAHGAGYTVDRFTQRGGLQTWGNNVARGEKFRQGVAAHR